MTNAEKFLEVFGWYATEMWAKPEDEFLNWINSEYKEHNPCDECQEFVCDWCPIANEVKHDS